MFFNVEQFHSLCIFSFLIFLKSIEASYFGESPSLGVYLIGSVFRFSSCIVGRDFTEVVRCPCHLQHSRSCRFVPTLVDSTLFTRPR